MAAKTIKLFEVSAEPQFSDLPSLMAYEPKQAGEVVTLSAELLTVVKGAISVLPQYKDILVIHRPGDNSAEWSAKTLDGSATPDSQSVLKGYLMQQIQQLPEDSRLIPALLGVVFGQKPVQAAAAPSRTTSPRKTTGRGKTPEQRQEEVTRLILDCVKAGKLPALKLDGDDNWKTYYQPIIASTTQDAKKAAREAWKEIFDVTEDDLKFSDKRGFISNPSPFYADPSKIDDYINNLKAHLDKKMPGWDGTDGKK